MKKFVLLCFFASILLTGCNSPQNRAEKLVKEYLKENLKDPDSYRNIKMGHVEKLTVIGLEQLALRDKIKAGLISAAEALDSMGIYRNLMVNHKINPDSIIAYYVDHKYRAKNSYGGYDISDVKYFFDVKITRIIDIKDAN